ncbi:hypothetical protein A7J50_1176 [Pseudomonas antarctica]|uniref:Uncharacterized protein n=2 Tax=Pseudomonas TaxID=286 RepID=A0A172YWF8_9PSED|nr:hypothetical protein A7J50_1176 [Pseudomonas antarctica]
MNELRACKEALTQVEALFFSMQNDDLVRETLDQLVILGASVAGGMSSQAEATLEKLRSDLFATGPAPRNGDSENVARDSEVRP